MPESALGLLALCRRSQIRTRYPVSFSWPSGALMRSLLSDVFQIRLLFHSVSTVWMTVVKVGAAVSVHLEWLICLLSHCERAIGRPRTRITSSALMEAGDSWSSALTAVKPGPFADQSFILSQGSFILSQGYVVRNISNDDSNTQWGKMLGRSFISCYVS